MECSCDLGVDDYSEMIESRTNKARKEHKCDECRDIIQIGEEYLVEKEVYEGDFSTHKTCLPCREVRNAYLHSFFWGQIWDDLRECMCGDISMADFEKFSTEAQQKILEKL